MTAPSRGSSERARQLAHHVLLRVARDRAFADRVLDVALSRAHLSQRDRALATELAYGTLRHQIHLDFLLGQVASRPLSRVSKGVLAALRLGAYQLLHTRVPPRAAVFESVALLPAHGRGFANAVLRKLATLHEAGRLPDPRAFLAGPLEVLAVEGSHPLWLLKELAGRMSEQELHALVAANNKRPHLAVRVNRLRATRDQVAQALRAAGVDVTVPDFFPDALYVGGGRVLDLPGFADGAFVVQDPAAQLVARLVAPQPDDLVLDACAAPGGKATQLAELMGDRGTVLAADIHRGRLRLVADSAQRLGLGAVKVAVTDCSDPKAIDDLLAAHGRAEVDAALVDAPCTGLGTLRRNPELRAQSSEAVRLLAQVQDRLLDAVAPRVAPGRPLVYAVCTPTAAEGPERVARFLSRHPEFALDRPADPTLTPFIEDSAEGPVVRTWPHRHGADGFYAARMVRAGSAPQRNVMPDVPQVRT